MKEAVSAAQRKEGNSSHFGANNHLFAEVV